MKALKIIHYLIHVLLFGSLAAGVCCPALAVPEFSGQGRAALEAYPLLKKQVCERWPESAGCDLSAVRVIGTWAWLRWSAGSRTGTWLLQSENNSWIKRLEAETLTSEQCLAAGIPPLVADFMIPSQALALTDTRDLLTAADLEKFSAWELRIARNAIFARHGRRFQTKLLNDYFLTWPWYRPDDTYSVTRLSEVERANAELIMNYEKQMGYVQGP